MLSIHTVPGTNLVELVVDGQVSAPDFDRALAHLNGAIAAHGSIRLLEEVRALGSVPLSRMWEDLKFGWEHMKDIERCAVVGHSGWIEAWTNIVKPFVRCPVRYFPEEEIEMARAWLLRSEAPGA